MPRRQKEDCLSLSSPPQAADFMIADWFAYDRTASIGRGEHDTGGISLRMRALEEEVHALRLALGTDHPSNQHGLRPIDHAQLARMGSYDCEGKYQERIDRLIDGIHVPSSLAAQLRTIQNVAPQRASADFPEHDTALDMHKAGSPPPFLANTTQLKSNVRAFFEECGLHFPLSTAGRVLPATVQFLPGLPVGASRAPFID